MQRAMCNHAQDLNYSQTPQSYVMFASDLEDGRRKGQPESISSAIGQNNMKQRQLPKLFYCKGSDMTLPIYYITL